MAAVTVVAVWLAVAAAVGASSSIFATAATRCSPSLAPPSLRQTASSTEEASPRGAMRLSTEPTARSRVRWRTARRRWSWPMMEPPRRFARTASRARPRHKRLPHRANGWSRRSRTLTRTTRSSWRRPLARRSLALARMAIRSSGFVRRVRSRLLIYRRLAFNRAARACRRRAVAACSGTCAPPRPRTCARSFPHTVNHWWHRPLRL